MIRLFCEMAISFLLSGSSAIGWSDAYHVTGRVIDSQNGQPISNARVVLFDAATNVPLIEAVYTNTDGYFDTSEFIAVNVEESSLELGRSVRLGTASPNPVASSSATVTIPYEAPIGYSTPELEIFDALGRRIDPEGAIASGVYFYRLRFDGGMVTPSRSIVLNVPSQPTFVLKPADEQIRARKSAVSAFDVDILVEKVGYTPQTVRIQPTANSVDVHDFNLAPSDTFNLLTEDLVPVEQSEIPSTGGTLAVDDPAGPLDGLILEIPSGAYSDTRTFEIDYATLVEHNLGEYFNPISPMIRISNGGGYSDSLMTLTVPVSVPDGHFAMAFYYDVASGKLEGIPIEAVSDSSITVMTRHFSTFSSTGKRGLESIGNLLVSSIAESVLTGQTTIDTGYRPGIDDWEYANYGSYIAPGGHCAGQSITSMWYYYEKRLSGQPQLNGLLDTVSGLQYDNPLGYRFASVIHKDLRWDGWLRSILLKAERNETSSSLQWEAFLYSILLTGEPQYVGLHRPGAGHAIIAYKISVSEGKIYVADPNYPTEVRVIEYRDGILQPYNTKQNASEGVNRPYPSIGYYAKSAFIDWKKIDGRWSEVLDEEIGDIAPNAFPEYTLSWKSDAGYEPIGERIETTVDTIAFRATCPDCDLGYPEDSAQDIYVRDSNGTLLAEVESNDGHAAPRLHPGDNEMGIRINGFHSASGGGVDALFIDYQRLTVHYTAPLDVVSDGPAGQPIAGPGITGELYTFSALLNTAGPENARYVWDFGDGNPEKVVRRDSTVQHAYDLEGVYTLLVTLYDASTEIILARDSAEVDIGNMTTITIPFSRVLPDDPVSWAPFATPVSGQMIVTGIDAVIDDQWSDFYLIRVLKDFPATLSLSISSLQPTEDTVEESTNPYNGDRDVWTYMPPYLRETSFEITGSFQSNISAYSDGIDITFTFDAFSGQRIYGAPRICYDRQWQQYDSDGTLVIDQMEAPWKCLAGGPTLQIEPIGR